MILITILLGYSILLVADQQPGADSGWQSSAQAIIGALDYVAIDYPEAVQAGSVVNADEFAEQREFLATVTRLLVSLPPRPAQQALLSQAQELASLVDQRAPGVQVASASRELAAGLIESYGIITAPLVAPDPASATPLYVDQCSGCHGISGHGDGLAGSALNPPPTNFHDTGRAQQRSLYGLYSTITSGVAGTAMPSFSWLTEDQRWALAFYVAGLSDDPTGDPIERTIDGLQNAVSAYDKGQPDTALQLALSAYLEGYELTEASLRTLDYELAVGIEHDMQVLRNMIRDGVPAEKLASAAASLDIRLQEASALLSASGSSTITLLTSAFLILFREGLEAILLLAAMALYLRRTENTTAMRYLHFGWLGALAVGALTWLGIKTVISISGAQREVIEGMAALLAAFVLLYVGIWLHRHSNAQHWQAFLNERLGKSLSTGTMWGIAALSFIAVYREIVETVLFYETLWLQSGTATPLVVGASFAAIALIAAGWMVFRVGARLPLRRFFQANGALMFVLAFIFVGKGIMALQEANWIRVTFISMPRIDWLGIYPTAQSAGAQLAIVCIGAIWLTFLSRHSALK